MPVNIQLLNQLIVGVPKSLSLQAITATTQIYAETLSAGKMYLFLSSGVCHIKFGLSGTSPSATINDFCLPPNQFFVVSTDKDIDAAIIRGDDEITDGKLWVSEMLETATRL